MFGLWSGSGLWWRLGEGALGAGWVIVGLVWDCLGIPGVVLVGVSVWGVVVVVLAGEAEEAEGAGAWLPARACEYSIFCI